MNSFVKFRPSEGEELMIPLYGGVPEGRGGVSHCRVLYNTAPLEMADLNDEMIHCFQPKYHDPFLITHTITSYQTSLVLAGTCRRVDRRGGRDRSVPSLGWLAGLDLGTLAGRTHRGYGFGVIVRCGVFRGLAHSDRATRTPLFAGTTS